MFLNRAADVLGDSLRVGGLRIDRADLRDLHFTHATASVCTLRAGDVIYAVDIGHGAREIRGSRPACRTFELKHHGPSRFLGAGGAPDTGAALSFSFIGNE